MTELIIAFRETLEASLIIGIILAYLFQTGRRAYQHLVFLAAFLATIFSAVLAVIFTQFLGGFSGPTEELFEGVLMITASVMVASVVLWMLKQRFAVKKIQANIDDHLNKGQEFGLFALVFLAVLREGVEVVLLLSAKSLDGSGNLWWALLGMVLAIAVGSIIFKIGARMNLRPFFLLSSLFLLLFGAGLMAHGIHELEEVGLINPIVEHVWDINWLINEKRGLGLFLKQLLGYNGNPSLVEVSSYIIYLNVLYFINLLTKRKNQ